MMESRKLYMTVFNILFLCLVSYSCKDTGNSTVESQPPRVTTMEVTNINFTSAEAHGKVTDDGGLAISERGIAWDTLSGPTIDQNYAEASGADANGEFSATLENLKENTTYHVRAYAKNDEGISYGSDLSFATKVNGQLPSVKTMEVTNINIASAEVHGTITDNGGFAVTERGFAWDTLSGPTIDGDYMEVSGAVSGKFSATLRNLKDHTTYHVRAYAKNSEGISYGSDLSFITKEGNIQIKFKKQQLIDIVGGDMERSSGFVLKATNTDLILQWAVRDIHFNAFRVRYDKHQEMEEGQKTFDFYSDQVKTMKKIKSINPDIKFWATMRTDYHGYGQGNHNNLPTFIYNYACVKKSNNKKCVEEGDKSFNATKYGIFLADYVEFMSNEGVPINYISMAKEYKWPVTVERSHQAYLKMKEELQNRGIAVPQVIGPATWAIKGGINYVKSIIQHGYGDQYAAFSTHNYHNYNIPHPWRDFVQQANKINKKKAYDDETGYAAGGRTSGQEPKSLSQLLNVYSGKSKMYRNGINGEMFFEIWSRGINSETRSIYFRANQPAKRMRSYYVMKKFANSVLNKYYVNANVSNKSNEDVAIMSFRDDSKLAVWLVNKSIRFSGSINLENLKINGDVTQYFWDDANQIGAKQKEIEPAEDNILKVSVPSVSINYFEIPIKQ